MTKPRSFAARRAAAALAVAFVLSTLTPARAQQPAPASVPDLKARLQASMDAVVAAGKFPGFTAGVVLADGTSLGLAAGVSDRDAKTPMKPSDRLMMGSVGKTYVAAVALQLVAEGKIGLEDKIEKWLGAEPWFGRLPNGRETLIRHLMTHTSGLVRYEFQDKFVADLTRQPDKIWTPTEELSYILDLKPPFAPGQGWEYSDTNFIVLGMILEKAAKARYIDLLRDRLLTPLRLKDTLPVTGRVLSGLAQGYAGPQNPFGGVDAMIKDGRFAFDPSFEWTGGGVYGTAEDLARWAKLLYEGKAFAPALLPKMLDGVPAQLGPDSKYGLGVIIRPTSLGPAWGHSGYFPGYLTEMMYFPDHKIALAVQFNSSVPRDIGRSPARVLLDLARIAAGVPPAK
jgi:D-alanyl-D-alanine carboxypeptidase